MTHSVIAIYGSSKTQPGTDEWANAELAGRLCAQRGFGVITGGYGGVMEAASKGASEAGGHVIGVTADALFADRTGANHWVDELIETQTLSQRLDILSGRASGALAMPGSIGTATELLVAWNTNHIARHNNGIRFPIATIGPEWRRIVATLSQELGALNRDVETVDDVGSALTWLFEQPEIR